VWREYLNHYDSASLCHCVTVSRVQVIFPCTLLGTEDPWTLMRTISVTEYLNYEDGNIQQEPRGGGIWERREGHRHTPEIWR